MPRDCSGSIPDACQIADSVTDGLLAPVLAPATPATRCGSDGLDDRIDLGRKSCAGLEGFMGADLDAALAPRLPPPRWPPDELHFRLALGLDRLITLRGLSHWPHDLSLLICNGDFTLVTWNSRSGSRPYAGRMG